MTSSGGAVSGIENLWSLILSGGFAMVPLLICSLLIWAVIFERLWVFRNLGRDLQAFHLEAVHILLVGDREAVMNLCRRNEKLPTSRLLMTALERLVARDLRLRSRWLETLERRRQLLNQELKRHLWILGTVGSAAPFIGLFGTVVGILRSFHEMAKTGSGGFTVVAGGISESLIATAAGIVVAVVAVMSFNAFQTRLNGLILTIKLHIEEFSEILEEAPWVSSSQAPQATE